MKLAQKFILDSNWKSETIIRFKFYLCKTRAIWRRDYCLIQIG